MRQGFNQCYQVWPIWGRKNKIDFFENLLSSWSFLNSMEVYIVKSKIFLFLKQSLVFFSYKHLETLDSKPIANGNTPLCTYIHLMAAENASWQSVSAFVCASVCICACMWRGVWASYRWKAVSSERWKPLLGLLWKVKLCLNAAECNNNLDCPVGQVCESNSKTCVSKWNFLEISLPEDFSDTLIILVPSMKKLLSAKRWLFGLICINCFFLMLAKRKCFFLDCIADANCQNGMHCDIHNGFVCRGE